MTYPERSLEYAHDVLYSEHRRGYQCRGGILDEALLEISQRICVYDYECQLWCNHVRKLYELRSSEGGVQGQAWRGRSGVGDVGWSGRCTRGGRKPTSCIG